MIRHSPSVPLNTDNTDGPAIQRPFNSRNKHSGRERTVITLLFGVMLTDGALLQRLNLPAPLRPWL